MTKVKVVKSKEGFSYFRAYRDPDDDGWQVSLEGTEMWIGDETLEPAIKFLTKLQKKASK